MKEQQFTYNEELLIAQDVIDKYYSEYEHVIAYRTFITNPPTKKDITPQIHRRQPDIDLNLSEEDYNGLTEKERKEYVSKRAISVHNTEEKEIKEAKRVYKQIKGKYGEDTAETYIQEQRGTLIGRIIITPEIGVFSGFKKGHGNLILRKDINIEEIYDHEFGLKSYNYKDDEDAE